MPFNKEEYSHIRYNPLSDTWVLVSSIRNKRPWVMGEGHKPPHHPPPPPHHPPPFPHFHPPPPPPDDKEHPHDYKNPLKPGAVRSSGIKNPDYKGIYVFDNDFPALFEHVPDDDENEDDLFITKKAEGVCKVICTHHDENLILPLMTISQIEDIIATWVNLYKTISKTYEWVQIFENRGAMMGCSNPHPHCQLWASNFLPFEVIKKDQMQMNYYKKHNTPLLLDYLAKELVKKERIVIQNEHWVCLVPYWAVWPYETMIIPRDHLKRLSDITDEHRTSLAKIMKDLVSKYDNLFKLPFPYSMGWHYAPDKYKDDCSHWVLHAMYYPPLIRPFRRKHMAGYELFAQPFRGETPEMAASDLKELSTVHYDCKDT